MPKRTTTENSFTRSKGVTTTPAKRKSVEVKNTEEKSATIMCYVPEDLKRDLKVYAANHGKSIKDLLREMIEEKIYN